MQEAFSSKNAHKLCKYAEEKYGDTLEFLWKNSKNAVLRKKGKKWYAVFLIVPKSKLGLQKDGLVEIVNLKLDPQDILAFVDNKSFFKAYHMNKKHWISIVLDDNAFVLRQLYQFLDESYSLV